MAVARDTFDAFQSSANGATSLTYSYTTSGSNRYIIVYGADLSGDSFTGVTYAAIATAQLVKVSRNPNSGSLEIYGYGLPNPASGANNVVISRTNVANDIEARTISYTGVHQSNTPATGASNGSGAANTITTPITTTANNTAVSGFSVMDNGSIIAGTGWTRLATGGGANGGAHALFESTAFPLTPAGTYNYTSDSSASASDIGQIIVALEPAAAGGGGLATRKSLLGVGI
jgi:hypothetical protein